MNTPSPVTHESPSNVSLDATAGPVSHAAAEPLVSGWSGRLRRAREILLGASHSANLPPVPSAALHISMVVPSKGAAPSSSQREDDRTTRIYQRPSLDAQMSALSAEELGSTEEASATMRLPSAALDELLLQIHAEVGKSSKSDQTDPSSPPELEVSSITHDELEQFRRSLVDRLTLPPEGVSEQDALLCAALQKQPEGLPPDSLRSRVRMFATGLARRVGPFLVRALFGLMDVRVACQARLTALRARIARRTLPVVTAASDGTKDPSDTSASKPN